MTASRPLSGLTVVSLEQAVAAPYCSSRLADAGARVIKIERPEGDFARGYDTAARGLSSYFVWLNRGKQSLVADIKQPEDAALLHRILARADVFIQNLAPGAAARAGFGSDELRERHPRLITVDISGYGDTGDYATMKAYDLLVQAESGLAMITGHPAGPGRVGVSACDIACGMAAHAGVLEALIERGITGRGKGLKVSLFDGMADWMNVPLLFYEGTGTRAGTARPRAPVDLSVWRVRDRGRRAGADLDPERARMGGVLRAASSTNRTCRNARVSRPTSSASPTAPMVDAHIAAAFARLSRAQAAAKLRAANTAYGFVNDVAAFSRHPALRRATVDTPNGPVSLAAPPVLDRRRAARLWGRCRRSASTPPRSAANSPPDASRRRGATRDG